ncbi:hypothetical protein HMPREF3225_02193 [Staphylococcus lugdunensis]|uniref:Uncharacterized protein n=1 Tax=Staphylococcus lugdunensis TaxID=28035 RepID=A0ABD4ECU2_STALU|nr:hypothetical protein HMPREF0790_1087 [Staphylococcus lugdunensis M23590]KXA36432.1 hypothetical protein HMPREF3225_02193 [Staphylococcus lugdunensis]
MSQPKKMRGPQQREMRNAFPQAKEVGFQQKNYVKIVPCF